MKIIKEGVKASELLADYEKKHPHRKKAGRNAAKKSNTYERGC